MCRFLLLLSFHLFALGWLAGSVVAAEIALGENCSLHDAILAAESDSSMGGCPAGSGPDAIRLTSDLTLEAALPPIQSEITIDGKGFTISGAGRFRIFDVQGGDLIMQNLTLRDGWSEQDGGAIRLRQGAQVSVENSSLKDNAATKGGAIALDGGSALMINASDFQGNKGEAGGGAIYADGGAVRVNASHFAANCSVRASHIVELNRDRAETESIVDADGCLRLTYRWSSQEEMVFTEQAIGGAIRIENGASFSVEASRFSKNKATQGGAIASSGNSALTIHGSSFERNEAATTGGAIFAFDGAVTIAASSFVKNAAESGGGAIGIRLATLDLSNSTLSENHSDAGVGALEIGGTTRVDITHATFVDNWSRYRDSGAIEAFPGAQVNLYNSIIDSRRSAEDCVGGLRQNIGNLSRDGTCAERATSEILLNKRASAGAHYPLLDGSPAVDSADSEHCLATDQLGNPRPQGGGCDVGAIESLTARPAEPTPEPVVCTLADHILAANTNRAVGACPAGSDHDIISFTQDIKLEAALPAITGTITIEGNGFSISGGRRFRIFDVNRGRLTINNLTMTDGKSFSGDGGAIRLQGGSQVSVNDSRFIKNFANNGGAIAVSSRNERLTVVNSFFFGNGAGYNGGALSLIGGAAKDSGSSFVSNSAGHDGGAIRVLNFGRLTLENSSLIHNRAYWEGDEISLENGAVADITHVTMVNAFLAGSGIALQIHDNDYGSASRANLRNSIIAGEGAAVLCVGELAQNEGNTIQRGCEAKLSDDPLFAEPVIDEATGAILHFPLREDSPALQAGDPQFCLPTDQIGALRPATDGCDMGAIERDPVPPSEAPTTPCQVTTTHRLNFRDAPGGKYITQLARGQTLIATGKTQGWFNVVLDGVSGWVSGDYVTTQGSCG